MKKLTIETLVPTHFEYLARDRDGKIFVFQNKPELTTDVDCDTWDVVEGEVLQITNSISVSLEESNSLLGNWKESLIDLKDTS
jgi:hypothetical protein